MATYYWVFILIGKNRSNWHWFRLDFYIDREWRACFHSIIKGRREESSFRWWDPLFENRQDVSRSLFFRVYSYQAIYKTLKSFDTLVWDEERRDALIGLERGGDVILVWLSCAMVSDASVHRRGVADNRSGPRFFYRKRRSVAVDTTDTRREKRERGGNLWLHFLAHQKRSWCLIHFFHLVHTRRSKIK